MTLKKNFFFWSELKAEKKETSTEQNESDKAVGQSWG